MALGTSLFIATIAGRFERRHVLTALTAVLLMLLMLIAPAPNSCPDGRTSIARHRDRSILVACDCDGRAYAESSIF